MTIGIKKPNKDGVITYYGETDLQGYFFKDFEAFEERRDDICYIAEAGFDEKGWLTEDEAKAEIEYGSAITHNSLFKDIKEELCRMYGEKNITDEFVEQACGYVFTIIDWQCASTFFNEVDWDSDYRCYWNERGKTFKTRNDYLAEVDAFASSGDTIKYLEDGIAHFNSCGCPLSKWIENTEEVIYW